MDHNIAPFTDACACERALDCCWQNDQNHRLFSLMNSFHFLSNEYKSEKCAQTWNKFQLREFRQSISVGFSIKGEKADNPSSNLVHSTCGSIISYFAKHKHGLYSEVKAVGYWLLSRPDQDGKWHARVKDVRTFQLAGLAGLIKTTARNQKGTIQISKKPYSTLMFSLVRN